MACYGPLLAEYEDQPFEDQSWYDGVVVLYEPASESPYIIFYDDEDFPDSQWERMDLPDVTVVYRGGLRRDVCVRIGGWMLPGERDLE